MSVKAGVTTGNGAEATQNWSGVIKDGEEGLAPEVLIWAPVD